MKKILIKALIVCLIVFALPFLLTLILNHDQGSATVEAMDFTINYEVNGLNTSIPFNEYLIGVVAANMPAGYEMEALKTQAVIARTYAFYNIALLRKEDAQKKNFTTSELGLPYIGLDSLKEYWGADNYSEYFSKLENAVYGTKNEVIIYDEQLILPVFFHTGSGYTRSAQEAWGVTVPYLVSIPSKQDVTSTDYLSIEEFEITDLITLLSGYYTDLTLTKDNFFDEVTIAGRDSAGYVTQINLGSQTVSGEEFAKVIGLASSHFYMEEYEEKARIICNGNGHGIGLSQYGANAMAQEGSSYEDILSYYYSGVSLTSLSETAP